MRFYGDIERTFGKQTILLLDLDLEDSVEQLQSLSTRSTHREMEPKYGEENWILMTLFEALSLYAWNQTPHECFS